MKSIGFIGLGTMGKPMAVNLLKKGFPVTVYNRTAAKAEELVPLGAELASTPAEAARTSEILITMLSDDEALMHVFYGTEGILQGIRPGMSVIDCSTVSPGTSRQLHAVLDEHLVEFLDAPVTGSQPAAVDGKLVFMVGGKREAFEAQQDVFSALGRKAVYMGPPGSGSCAKLAHNAMVGIHAVALAEGMSLAASAGIDPEKFLEIVLAGGAGSRQAELKGMKILERDFASQFSMQLMLKDLYLASQLTKQFQLPAPLLYAASSVFQMGVGSGLGQEDSCAVIQCYEQWMHRKVAKQASAKEEARQPQAAGEPGERRKSERVPMNIKLHLSVYQWEQEGSFSGQNIEGTLTDLSEHGLQIASSSPLAPEMFIVVHFPRESGLPPIIVKILRAERKNGRFHYGCMISGLPPYTRIKLEEYIKRHREKLSERQSG